MAVQGEEKRIISKVIQGEEPGELAGGVGDITPAGQLGVQLARLRYLHLLCGGYRLREPSAVTLWHDCSWCSQ